MIIKPLNSAFLTEMLNCCICYHFSIPSYHTWVHFSPMDTCCPFSRKVDTMAPDDLVMQEVKTSKCMLLLAYKLLYRAVYCRCNWYLIFNLYLNILLVGFLLSNMQLWVSPKWSLLNRQLVNRKYTIYSIRCPADKNNIPLRQRLGQMPHVA